MAKLGDLEYTGWSMVASGYAAVWATENTREALFDAMMRKETYATTGPRMLVRFFGGWDFTDGCASRLPADVGYAKGVPMGGDLPEAPEGKAPHFLVAALKDPLSGNLDRIQIVKGWLDAEASARRRSTTWSGRVTGSRAQTASCRRSATRSTWRVRPGPTRSAPRTDRVWTDPDFDPMPRAVYYARVLEIPTPRWTAYEAMRFGIEMPDEVPMITQERAYTSPIWYTP